MGRDTYNLTETRDEVTGVTKLEARAVLPCGANYCGCVYAVTPDELPARRQQLENMVNNAWLSSAIDVSIAAAIHG